MASGIFPFFIAFLCPHLLCVPNCPRQSFSLGMNISSPRITFCHLVNQLFCQKFQKTTNIGPYLTSLSCVSILAAISVTNGMNSADLSGLNHMLYCPHPLCGRRLVRSTSTTQAYRETEESLSKDTRFSVIKERIIKTRDTPCMMKFHGGQITHLSNSL